MLRPGAASLPYQSCIMLPYKAVAERFRLFVSDSCCMKPGDSGPTALIDPAWMLKVDAL